MSERHKSMYAESVRGQSPTDSSLESKMVLLAMVCLSPLKHAAAHRHATFSASTIIRFVSTIIQVDDGLAYHGAVGAPRGVRAVDAIETERLDLTRQVIVSGRVGSG